MAPLFRSDEKTSTGGLDDFAGDASLRAPTLCSYEKSSTGGLAYSTFWRCGTWRRLLRRTCISASCGGLRVGQRRRVDLGSVVESGSTGPSTWRWLECVSSATCPGLRCASCGGQRSSSQCQWRIWLGAFWMVCPLLLTALRQPSNLKRFSSKVASSSSSLQQVLQGHVPPQPAGLVCRARMWLTYVTCSSIPRELVLYASRGHGKRLERNVSALGSPRQVASKSSVCALSSIGSK